VLDEALGGEAGHHLADAWRRDSEALRKVAGWDRTLVSAQLVERLEVILLGSGEGAAALDLVNHSG
jgi:hypothetical protein